MTDSDVEVWEVEPTPGRVTVRVLERSEITEAGLFIPETVAPDRPTTGEVVAVCKDYFNDETPMEALFKVGDILIFGKYTGTSLTVGRLKLIILRENDVLGWLRGNHQRLVDKVLGPQGPVRVVDRD